MPRSYSEKERESIVSDLRFHAAQCLKQYGVKKTTVDELVRRARIPKGTFYLFYGSKEELLFEVLLQWHDSLQTEFLKHLEACGHPVSADDLTDVFFDLCQQVQETGLITILSNGEVEALMRRLPEELVLEHLSHDDDSVESLMVALGLPKERIERTAKAFSAAFRGVFFMLLFRHEIGDDFDSALRLSIRGLAIQMLEED